MRPVPLSDARDEGCFGGKAVQLGAAVRAGLPVPGGWALSVSLVDAIAEGDNEAVANLRAFVEGAKLPLAVRSSAVGEDSGMASFAGQHLTQLNVTSPGAIVESVGAVWASGRTEYAEAYRKRMGLTGAPRMGIVLQRLVDADVAGVLFSRDPITGSDERVVEAAWGLGDSVVSGLVTPDRFRVSRNGEILKRIAGEKDLAIRLQADGGTQEVAVDGAQQRNLCLDDSQLLELHGLAARCEAVFGEGRDLEWAFSGRTVYLLQCRPITRVLGQGRGN